MAGVKPQQSPWALRLAIIGALMLITGGLILSSQDGAIDSIYDPRERAIAEITAGDSQPSGLTIHTSALSQSSSEHVVASIASPSLSTTHSLTIRKVVPSEAIGVQSVKHLLDSNSSFDAAEPSIGFRLASTPDTFASTMT